MISVSIPPVSYDYTLVSLYAPLAILCILALRLPDDKQRVLIPYFMLFAALLTPQSYIHLPRRPLLLVRAKRA